MRSRGMRAHQEPSRLGRIAILLWTVALLLVTLYIVVRWGGAGPSDNLMPSAD